MVSSAKDQLHRLIDGLEAGEADRLLEAMSDPRQRSLVLAPTDDEPLTDDERRAIAEGEAAYRRGEWVADDALIL